jgi:hypothetical protein
MNSEEKIQKLLTKMVVVAWIFGLVSGCAYEMKTAFTEDGLAPYWKEGTATVTGQAFLRFPDGRVSHAPSGTVMMMPVTAYSTELVQNTMQGHGQYIKTDPKFERYVRYSPVVGQGNFAFRQVPAGQYYVYTRMTWSSFAGGGNMWVVKQIDVADGEQKQVELTR